MSDCILDLHNRNLSLSQFQTVMATTISHHKNRDNENGPDHVSKYILTHKCRKYHTFNLWLLQNLMLYPMKKLQMRIPHHHQLDIKLNRALEEKKSLDRKKKDPDHVNEYLHTHLRMPASSHNLQCHLLVLSRL